MVQTIDYYFFSASPFSYLGHDAIINVAAEHGAKLNYKPVNLFGLWEVSGAVPPGKRPPVRQRYRLLEIERVAAYRGLPIKSKPAFFPVDATLADLTTVAIVEAGGYPGAYVASVFTACWVQDRNIADEAVLGELLTTAGHDASAILQAAQSDTISEIRGRNTQDAIAADAVGAPAYVLNGEVFWGQDRVEYVAKALESGRAPIIVSEPAG